MQDDMVKEVLAWMGVDGSVVVDCRNVSERIPDILCSVFYMLYVRLLYM